MLETYRTQWIPSRGFGELLPEASGLDDNIRKVAGFLEVFSIADLDEISYLGFVVGFGFLVASGLISTSAITTILVCCCCLFRLGSFVKRAASSVRRGASR